MQPGVPDLSAPQIQVHPQLTPVQVVLTPVDTPEGKRVMFQIFTIIGGPIVLFLPPENAVQLGQQFVAAGRAASSSLILPPSATAPSSEQENTV